MSSVGPRPPVSGLDQHANDEAWLTPDELAQRDSVKADTTTAVVPINPRHWQTLLWDDQSLWDGLGALVLAELDERVWNVMDRDGIREQTALLALKHGYVDELEDYVADLEASDREMRQPPRGSRRAWVFDFPMYSILGADDVIATSILPRVPVEPEPELETAEQLVVPPVRKWWRK